MSVVSDPGLGQPADTVTSSDLLTRDDVLAWLKISHSTLKRWVRESDFPASIKLGPKCFRWRRSEVKVWVDGREHVSRRQLEAA